MEHPPLSGFTRDSRLERVGEREFAVDVTREWCIGDAANGGYSLSLGVRAIAETVPLPVPLTSTAHYLAPVLHGPLRIEVETIRIGRTLARGVARLVQGGRECVRVLAAFGALPAEPAPPLYAEEPPLAPAPLEECTALVLGTPSGIPGHVRAQLDTRYDPESVGWARGRPTGRSRLAAWTRLADGGEPDRFLLPLVADALPCSAFELPGVTERVLTIELTVHQRAVPAPGWLCCAFRADLVADGYLGEDGWIWDSSGRLVAESRQLALLP